MRYKSIIPMALLFLGILTGCEGCFDDDLTNKVDAPNFTLKRGSNYDVALTSDTKGATIFYTVDGTDPLTSETVAKAEKETPISIDFYTEIQAYATKEGKIDSSVVSFKLPRFSARRKIFYNSDNSVNYYHYLSNDSNGNRKFFAVISDKGSDGQWFTGDDTIDYYNLYIYDGDTLSTLKRVTGAGDDGRWATADDVVDSVVDVTINDTTYDFGSYTEEYDSSDRLVTTTEFVNSETYSYGVGYKPTSVDIAGDTVSYSYTDNQDYYYNYSTDASGNVVKSRFLGYGSDTQWGATVETLNDDALVESSTFYWDNAKKCEMAYYEYAYSDGKQVAESKYSDSSKETLRFRTEQSYDDTGRLAGVDYFNSSDERERYETYSYSDDGSTATMTRFLRPDVATYGFEVDLTVDANVVDGGSYSCSGSTFSHNGVSTSDLVAAGSDIEGFVSDVAEKLDYIIQNVDFTDSSLALNGRNGGSVSVLVSTYGNTINIVFEFNGYNDGTLIINGTLDKEISGTIDLSGNVGNSELDGRIYGSLTVVDATATFSDDDYIQEAVVAMTLDTNGNAVEEVEYNTAGADGAWATLDDNSVAFTTVTSYAGTKVSETAMYKGDDVTDLDALQYRIVYTYSGETLVDEKVFRNVAQYGERTVGSTASESYMYYVGCRAYWDVKHRLELDWDDDYWSLWWQYSGDNKDLVEWGVE